MRFCINCGREIGEEVCCTDPECGGIPNFYRNVPGPDDAERAPANRSRKSRVPPPKPGQPVTSDTQVEDLEPRRATVGLDSQPVAVLRSTSPPPAEHLITTGSFEVGARPPAKIVIDRPEISSRHARIDCVPEPAGGHRISVVDHGSKNGTYLNGKRIQRGDLAHGDRIRFAIVEFQLQLIAEERPRVTIEM